MRNFKEATRDPANKAIADGIMEALAPLGFQDHSKIGEVAIRSDGLSRKECMDITYKLLLEASGNRIQILKLVAREVAATQAKLVQRTAVAEELLARYEHKWWRWVNGKQEDYRNLCVERLILADRLAMLSDFRLTVLTTGPQIPDEVIKKQKI